jgi:hypothetical protein
MSASKRLSEQADISSGVACVEHWVCAELGSVLTSCEYVEPRQPHGCKCVEQRILHQRSAAGDGSGQPHGSKCVEQRLRHQRSAAGVACVGHWVYAELGSVLTSCEYVERLNVFQTVSSPSVCLDPSTANRAFHLRNDSFPVVGDIAYLRLYSFDARGA